MSEKMMDAERARVVDAMCMTWRHDFGLNKQADWVGSSGMTDDERDALRRRMGQLYDHHFAQSRACQPVGVPDGESIRRAAVAAATEVWGDGEGEWTEDDERFYPAFVRILLNQGPAAPTVKAEHGTTSDQYRAELESIRDGAARLKTAGALYVVRRLQSLVQDDDDRRTVLQVAWDACETLRHKNNKPKPQPTAPSLPAAGLAVESLDAVAWLCEASKEGVKTQRRIVETWAETKDFTDHYHGRGCKVVTTALVSKRKHVAIVAALSAQQSAPERVSVPRELLERAIHWLRSHAPSTDCAEWDTADELRALLASHQRGDA